jgi:hypothetical protein
VQPHLDAQHVSVIHAPSSIQATSINLIFQAVGALYRFLVRRSQLNASPVLYVEVPTGKWLTERSLLAHTRQGPQKVQQMELKLKEPETVPETIADKDFKIFVDGIHTAEEPNGTPLVAVTASSSSCSKREDFA